MVSYALAKKRKDTSMGKIKYSEEMKLQTVKYVLDGGKSATKVAKELGMESFFATLNKELTFRKTYATIEEVRTDLYRYIELFYNRKRLHSTLGYMSSVDYRLSNS